MFLHADSEDYSDWSDALADLSLRWAQRPFGWFCHEVAQIASGLIIGMIWVKHFCVDILSSKLKK